VRRQYVVYDLCCTTAIPVTITSYAIIGTYNAVSPDTDADIVTIATVRGRCLANDEVDGTCVGEPWNSVAVERGVGRIVLVTAQNSRRGVEKVLAMPVESLMMIGTRLNVCSALHFAAG
jgi:NitT/TauT family transport system ATP-binding protein